MDGALSKRPSIANVRGEGLSNGRSRVSLRDELRPRIVSSIDDPNSGRPVQQRSLVSKADDECPFQRRSLLFNADDDDLPRRFSRASINKEAWPKRLSRPSINYGERRNSEIIPEADKQLPQELQEHKRKRRMFSRLRLKKLEEARYGLYNPLSPRSVERKWRSKEKIRKIVSMLKMSPRVIVRGEGKNKDWKIRPSAQESSVVKHLRDRLYERKERMKPFTSNRLFEKILENTTWCLVTDWNAIYLSWCAIHKSPFYCSFA